MSTRSAVGLLPLRFMPMSVIHSLLTAFSSTPAFSSPVRGLGQRVEGAPQRPVESHPPHGASGRGPDAIVELSPEARQAAEEEASSPSSTSNPRRGDTSAQEGESTEQGEATSETESTGTQQAGETKSSTGQPLTEEEQKQVEELKKRDQEVRQHEQAHKAAAGPYARGGPNYSYQTGPEGKRYATGGSVQIDTSPVAGDPEATIRKMEVVQRAALAPAEPSGQDQKIAAQAAQQAQKARQKLAQKNRGGGAESNSAVGELKVGDGENNDVGAESETVDNGAKIPPNVTDQSEDRIDAAGKAPNSAKKSGARFHPAFVVPTASGAASQGESLDTFA